MYNAIFIILLLIVAYFLDKHFNNKDKQKPYGNN